MVGLRCGQVSVFGACFVLFAFIRSLQLFSTFRHHASQCVSITTFELATSLPPNHLAGANVCLLIRSNMRTSSAHPPRSSKPPSRMICGFAPINPSVFIKDLHSSCKNPASVVRIIDKMSGFCRCVFSVFVRFIARFEVCCRIGLRVRINKR